MADTQIPTLKKGFLRLRKNPQLWWTVFVATVIFVAFVFVADRFVSIAQDAQDRLINVRVGSIHDTLAQYIDQISDNPQELNRIVNNIRAQNQTIREFRVVSVVQGQNIVLASLNKGEVGQILNNANRLTTFAFTDPKNSFTSEIVENNQRIFITIRAFTDTSGQVVGYIETKQTLSEADRLINDNIKNSMAIFVGVVLIVMFLFLRHAKIVDYISLYKQLQQVDDLKDDFISMASHELKTPLSVIRGYAEFLRDSRELSPENKEYAERIDISSKKLTNLVEDMLNVSRIEQGRMKFVMTDVDIDTFAKETLDEFRVKASEKNLKLGFETEGDRGMVLQADKDKLGRSLINLIGNAIKYTNEGHVILKINSKKDQFVEIRVSDTGIGLTQEEAGQLFQKFHRIRTKETEEISGTGLGLWITKQMVEKMGGTISVESIKGKGTDFVMKFLVK